MGDGVVDGVTRVEGDIDCVSDTLHDGVLVEQRLCVDPADGLNPTVAD
jgi:hypothetical protein